jgi:hypothetical protein
MKINKIDLKSMRNDAHFQFFSDFRDAVTKVGAATLKIKPQFNEWFALFEKEDEALKKISKSALTQQIQDADKLRDDTFLGMVEITVAYLDRGAVRRILALQLLQNIHRCGCLLLDWLLGYVPVSVKNYFEPPSRLAESLVAVPQVSPCYLHHPQKCVITQFVGILDLLG